MQFKTAERKKVKLKIAVSSPSGGGKTYSSLLLGFGLCGDWQKVFCIDTENGSAALYSHLGPFMHMEMGAPYTPERYIEAIEAATKAGAQVIIIDSISHEHEGEGGGLDIQAKLGGRFQDWQKVTPRHRKFINAMLQANAHVIATMRRKSDYEITNENGKKTVSKVGLKEVQREGIEYEFTVHLGLGQNYIANALKDRTGLFAAIPDFVITPDTGKMLTEWTESGKEVAPPEPEKFTGTDTQKAILFGIFKKHNVTPEGMKLIAPKLAGVAMESLEDNVLQELNQNAV